MIFTKITCISKTEIKAALFDIEDFVLTLDMQELFEETRGLTKVTAVQYYGSYSDIESQVTYWRSSIQTK